MDIRMPVKKVEKSMDKVMILIQVRLLPRHPLQMTLKDPGLLHLLPFDRRSWVVYPWVRNSSRLPTLSHISKLWESSSMPLGLLEVRKPDCE